MSVFLDVVNSIVAVGQTVSDFFTTGLYDYTVKAVSWAIRWLMVSYWTAKLAALNFSYDVAQDLMSTLNLSAVLNGAWSSLESRTLSMLTFFKVPDAVNMVLSASVTKFVFRILGF